MSSYQCTLLHESLSIDLPYEHTPSMDIINTPYQTGDNGPALSAQLFSPYSVWLNATAKVLSTMYIADWNNHAIRKYSFTTKVVTTVVGAGPLGAFGYSGVYQSINLSFNQTQTQSDHLLFLSAYSRKSLALVSPLIPPIFPLCPCFFFSNPNPLSFAQVMVVLRLQANSIALHVWF